MARGINVNTVMVQLIPYSNYQRTTDRNRAAPTNQYKTVPIRFRTPSTSVMVLELKPPT